MDNRTKLDDDITTREQHQTFKEVLLRLLDDPQIQQKIGIFLRRSGLTRSTGINVPSALVSLIMERQIRSPS
jgi:hypothetical protein